MLEVICHRTIHQMQLSIYKQILHGTAKRDCIIQNICCLYCIYIHIKMVVEFVSRAKQKIIEGKEKKCTKIAKNM